jgi:hypothetical protein
MEEKDKQDKPNDGPRIPNASENTSGDKPKVENQSNITPQEEPIKTENENSDTMDYQSSVISKINIENNRIENENIIAEWTVELAKSTKVIARWTRWLAVVTFIIAFCSIGSIIYTGIQEKESEKIIQQQENNFKRETVN